MSSTFAHSLASLRELQQSLFTIMRDISISDPESASAIFNISIDNAVALSKLSPQALNNLKEINAPLFRIKEDTDGRCILKNIIQSLNNNDLDKLKISVAGSI